MAASIRTVKALKHRFALRSANSWPCVFQAHHRPFITLQQPKRYRSTGRRELDRVIDEVRDRLEKQIVITRNSRRFAQVKTKVDPLVLGDRMIQLMHSLQDFGELNGSHSNQSAAVLNFSDPQQG